MTDDKIENLRDDIERLRETNSRLNRRCQKAEAALAEKVGTARNLGRMAANSTAARRQAELDRANVAIDQIRVQLDGCLAKLREIRTWADGYPVSVFSEPTAEQLEEWAEKIGPNNFTALHGSWARRITSGVRTIIDDAEDD